MKRGPAARQQTLTYPAPRVTTRSSAQPATELSRKFEAQPNSPNELSRKFDVIPEARDYGFEDVYHGKYGSNAALRPGDTARKALSPNPLFIKVDNLEAAKRKATGSFSMLVASSDQTAVPALAAAATRDQQDVLRHRISVMNALIQDPHSHLCVEHKRLEKAPHALVSVTYNRYLRESMESETEVGEIQSAMSWFLPGAQKHVADLLTPGPGTPPMQNSLKGILMGLKMYAPVTHNTKKLLKSLKATFPTELAEVLDFHRGSTKEQQHYQASAITSHHTRVFQADAEIRASPRKPDSKAENVRMYVIKGVLDVNVLEQWQNPSTNMLVRKSIIQAATHHAPPDGLSNVHSLHIKLVRGTESHVLSFQPFLGDEACTVSHLTFEEEAGGAGQKGLLRLNEDPTVVQGLAHAKIQPLASYVCLGAHRENRYNEAQLNYIHSRGYIHAGTVAGATLPPAGTIQWDSDMPAAKATRISGKDCDVMASSYHLGGAVHTTISVIRYPPFGTQFKIHPRKTDTEKQKHAAKRLLMPDKPVLHKVKYERMPVRKVVMPGYPPHAQADKLREGQAMPGYPLHAQAVKLREGQVVPAQAQLRERQEQKKERWTTAPDFDRGQFYFVDGVALDPRERGGRLYLIDAGRSETQAVMAQGVRIRDELVQECRFAGADGQSLETTWNPALSFYMNLRDNQQAHPITRDTPRDLWQEKWRAYISGWMPKQGGGGAFWLCKSPQVWAALIPDDKARQAHQRSMQARFVQAVKTGAISMKFVSTNGLAGLLPPQIIPRPVMQAKQEEAAGNAKELGHLQARIQSLESKLDQTKRDGNTAALMQEVLARLRQSC